ncbi:protein AKNAD1 isoform X2 [Mastomys coucha]|uniref:protein AKNAD1 isoform X2 n=1 Tax=Mastomys coucha TaxID=35658 RepID=UPI001261C648|nr:protein AKNAD1 isoform X2 [Mastomys coucha]
MPRPGSGGPQMSAHTIMNKADFSEDTTYKQQEDLPYDGDFSQMKMCTSYNFTLTNGTFPVPVEVVLAGEDPQDVAVHCEVRLNTALPETWDKMIEHVSNRHEKDKQCALASPVPADKADTSKSRVSDVSVHHLSGEQFFRGQDTGYETLLETSNAESLDDSNILTNITSCYAKNYRPKEQTPEFPGQPIPQDGSANSSKACCCPGMEGENTSPLEKAVTAGKRHHQEEPSFLTRTKGPDEKYKSCLRQTLQRQLPDKASSGDWFRYGQAQVHYQFPDFSKVAPKVKISRNTVTSKPLTIANQVSHSRLRNKSTVVQDNLGIMSGSGSHRIEKQPKQEWEAIEPLKPIQVQPAEQACQDPLTGLEPEKCHLNLTPTPQKDTFSNPYIFQKISQGKQMCQKLKEQTDQLKNKVQEFSKRIKQDSLCRLQDIRPMTKEHAGCLPGSWDSQGSEVTGLPRGGPQEATSKELSELAPKMKQKMEKRGHRPNNCGKFSSSIHEKTPPQDLPLGSDPGPSFCPDPGTGLQSNKCEAYGSKTRNSQTVCEADPPKACSKAKWICYWGVNSDPGQDERDPAAGKHLKTYLTSTSDLTTTSPHLHFLGIPRIQSLCSSSMEEMDSKILNSPLDQALRTTTKLKKATDQMIKSIAEDLTKAQRWRHQLRHY